MTIFNNYSPKAQLILLNNPRDEDEVVLVTSKMAANMATIFGDGIGLQQRPHPYTSPCCPLNAKSFRNTAAYQKFWGRVPLTPLVG